MLEPEYSDEGVGRGILIAKQLLIAKEEVLVRLMNVNPYPMNLKKGTILGKCVTISSIHHHQPPYVEDGLALWIPYPYKHTGWGWA
jgi:hypothetical protein